MWNIESETNRTGLSEFEIPGRIWGTLCLSIDRNKILRAWNHKRIQCDNGSMRSKQMFVVLFCHHSHISSSLLFPIFLLFFFFFDMWDLCGSNHLGNKRRISNSITYSCPKSSSTVSDTARPFLMCVCILQILRILNNAECWVLFAFPILTIYCW